MLGAILGVIGLVLTANLFGTSRGVEVFFAAQIVSQVLFRVIQSSHLSNAFLPEYHRIKKENGPELAYRAYAVVLNRILLVAVLGATLTYLLAPFVLQVLVPGFSDADHELATAMFRVICFLIPLQIAGGMQVALANAERWFGRVELMGPVAQAVTIAIVLTTSDWLGVWALVVAMVVARMVQNLGYIWIVRQLGYRHRWSLCSPGFKAGLVFRNLWATSGQMLAAQVFYIAINAAVSVLPQGTYAVFRYVRQIQEKMNGLFQRPVSLVFFTEVAEAIQRDPACVRVLARRALSLTVIIAIASGAVLVASARPLLNGLWGSERFEPNQIGLAAWLLISLAGLLVTQGATMVLLRLVVAAGMMSRLFLGVCVVLLLASAAVWWCTPIWGLAAVVVVIYLTQILQIIWSFWLLKRWRPEFVFSPDWGHVGRTLMTAIPAAGVGMLLERTLSSMPWAGERLGQVVLAALSAAVCGLVFLVIGKALQLAEVNRLFAMIGNRWPKFLGLIR